MKKQEESHKTLEELEEQAIDRIRRFAKLADKMGFEVCLGFSGGKDSQVCYDLCKRSGIKFKAYYNHCFESNTTRQFIREQYPEVIYRRVVKEGFIRNISKNHGGLLPTVQRAYCCNDYKHNPKLADACSMVGVRKAESAKRSKRTALSIKNKTTVKKNKEAIDEYFFENCQSIGGASVIQLAPIVDWLDKDVWEYIYKYNLPFNPEYTHNTRVGCIVCPKTNFSFNYKVLLERPKLIDAFIKARENGHIDVDWVIHKDGKDYSDDKCYYICRWLNYSFMPFSKKQEGYYKLVEAAYKELHKVNE